MELWLERTALLARRLRSGVYRQLELTINAGNLWASELGTAAKEFVHLHRLVGGASLS